METSFAWPYPLKDTPLSSRNHRPLKPPGAHPPRMQPWQLSLAQSNEATWQLLPVLFSGRGHYFRTWGFLFSLCSWCLWNKEVYPFPIMGSSHILCPQKSLLQSRNCVRQAALERDGGGWGEEGSGEKQMYTICWSKQCSCSKMGPFSSAVRAMQINTSPCWLFFLSSHH